MRTNRPAQTLLLAIAISSSLAAAEAPATLFAVGTAHDSDTGYLLYREYHYCEQDRLLCTVEYRDTFGLIFAKKHLDYRQSPVSPALVFSDYRRGVEVRIPAGANQGVVVDAGFDNFVRSIWDTLVSGDSKKFLFLPMGFDAPFKMKAERSHASDCPPATLCLKIAVDSWFLGIITDPIELAYSRTERRLHKFSGISNIKAENGQSLSVDIHYRYDADPQLMVFPQASGLCCEPNSGSSRISCCLQHQKVPL